MENYDQGQMSGGLIYSGQGYHMVVEVIILPFGC